MARCQLMQWDAISSSGLGDSCKKHSRRKPCKGFLLSGRDDGAGGRLGSDVERLAVRKHVDADEAVARILPGLRDFDLDGQRMVIELRVGVARQREAVALALLAEALDLRGRTLGLVLMDRHVIRDPEFAALAHRRNLVEEREVFLRRHGPEVLVAALRVVDGDAVKDYVFAARLLDRLRREGQHVVLSLEVVSGAMSAERRPRDKTLRLADRRLLLAVDVPASGQNAGLSVGDETPRFPGDVRTEVIRALAELFHRAVVAVEAVVGHRMVSEAEERILEELLPTSLEDLELTLLRDDVEVRRELAGLECGHRGLPDTRPTVVEHQHERGCRVILPFGDGSIAGRREQRDRAERTEGKDKFLHSSVFLIFKASHGLPVVHAPGRRGESALAVEQLPERAGAAIADGGMHLVQLDKRFLDGLAGRAETDLLDFGEDGVSDKPREANLGGAAAQAHVADDVRDADAVASVKTDVLNGLE